MCIDLMVSPLGTWMKIGLRILVLLAHGVVLVMKCLVVRESDTTWIIILFRN